MECVLLHGWGVSNTIWKDFAGQLNGFDNVSTPSLYEAASEAEDNKLESIAAVLGKKITSNSIVVAWSLGGLIAIYMAKATNKIKAIIFIASPPCFLNQKDWPNVIDAENIDDLQNSLLNNSEDALEYFAGLIAHGDVSIKETNKFIRRNLADKKHKAILSSWLKQMQQTDLRKEFAELNIPIQIILGEKDSLINIKLEDQIKQLNYSIRCNVVKNCGHAPFIDKQEETNKLINEFINTKFN